MKTNHLSAWAGGAIMGGLLILSSAYQLWPKEFYEPQEVLLFFAVTILLALCYSLMLFWVLRAAWEENKPIWAVPLKPFPIKKLLIFISIQLGASFLEQIVAWAAGEYNYLLMPLLVGLRWLLIYLLFTRRQKKVWSAPRLRWIAIGALAVWLIAFFAVETVLFLRLQDWSAQLNAGINILQLLEWMETEELFFSLCSPIFDLLLALLLYVLHRFVK